jgi:hypothetical protein
MTDPEFYEILGYLSSPIRNTKLDVETHPNKRNKFENQYAHLSGVQAQQDDHNYYVWGPDANKWGTEMRIYFHGNDNVPQALKIMIVTARPGFGYNSRVNNNDFIWRLIQHGFLLQDGQDLTRVRGLVPANYNNDFNHGLNL